MLKKQSSQLWVIVGILLVVWTALLFRMDEPFWGHHENPPTWMSAAVRTFNQYGAASVNFMVVRTPGPTTPEDGWYYLHHPPLIIWIEAITSQFFGYDADTLVPHESSIRMVAYVATMLTLSLFYVIARRLSNQKTALIALALYAFTPLTLYFGRTPHYDIMLMPFVYAFVAIFINWMRHYTQARTIALICVAIAMMWIDWPGAFYLTAMGIFALIFGKRQQRIGIVVIGVITLIATAAIPVMYEVLRPGSITEIFDILSLRTSTREAGFDSSSFTLVEFFARYFYDMVTVISFAVTILGAVGLVRLFFLKKTVNIYLLLALVMTPYVFMAIVPNSFHFHDWYKVHFLPSFGIAAAMLIYRSWSIPPDGLKRYIKPLVVAILITSLGLTIVWSIRLHQTSINNTFGREVAADLPLYTQEDDVIYSNVTSGFNKIEFYAYRNVQWGFLPETFAEDIQLEENLDAFYLLCLSPETVDSYDGLFSEYEYEQVGRECRLIDLGSS